MKMEYEKFKKLKEMQELGVPKVQIADKLGITLCAVRKNCEISEKEFFNLQDSSGSKMEYYRDFILDIIKICPQIKETNILYRMKEAFPEFVYKRVSFYRYMKKLREENGYAQLNNKSKRRGIRETPQPGYEAQVDFGQYKMLDMYGKIRRVYFFVMVLSYSNMRYVYFSAEPFTTQTAILAHDYAFKYFNGRPQVIVYDQDRVFVVSENFGDIIFVKEFEEYVKSVGYSIYLCRGSDPQTKGRVEAMVGHTKRQFLDGRVYCGIDSLNAACLDWLDSSGNESLSTHSRKTARELFQEESKCLVPYLSKPIEQKVYSVYHGTHIKYKGNQYAIPFSVSKTCKKVRIEESDNVIILYDFVTSDYLCKYSIPTTTGNTLVIASDVEIAPVSIEGVKAMYDNDQIAVKFIDGIEISRPKYASRQCQRLMNITNYYKQENLLEAMLYCIDVGKCSVAELVPYLIYKHGEEQARRFTYLTLFYIYRKRAEEIKEELNGNSNN